MRFKNCFCFVIYDETRHDRNTKIIALIRKNDFGKKLNSVNLLLLGHLLLSVDPTESPQCWNLEA